MLEILYNTLPLFAWILEGYALVADETGTIRRLVDKFGRTYRELEGSPLPAFSAGSGSGPASLPCPVDKDSTMWAIPFGDYTVCVSENRDRQDTYQKLQETLREALPSIAKVVGGEAVLFDREGTRLLSVNSQGKESREYMGRVSELARRCMRDRKTVMGDSNYIVGAKAVRIPVCDSFGIGFNNNDVVAQRQKLLDSIYQNKKAQALLKDFYGDSTAVATLRTNAQDVAGLDSYVLIVGERGTGKEMLAQAIHNASTRRERPFVTVNCDAMEQDLLEGVIFGYADAAFQGVRRGSNHGAIAAAGEGTLLLNHVDHLDAHLQARLLEAITTGEFSPVGDDGRAQVRARIIATAGKRIYSMTEIDSFDPRLFQRLAVNILSPPALEEIREDIPVLVQAFLGQLNTRYGAFVESVDQEAMAVLTSHGWRGNVGELLQVLQSAYTHIGSATILKKYNLPLGLLALPAPEEGQEKQSADKIPYDQMLEDYEAQIIKGALLKNNGSRQKTALQLGISKPSLWRKMKKLQIQ